MPFSEEFEQRLSLYKTLSEELERVTITNLQILEHIDNIRFRVKKTNSFIKKLEKKQQQGTPYHYPFSEVEDQIAGRVLVFFISDIAAVNAKLRDVFTPVEDAKREPQKYDEFGYESHHFIFTIPSMLKPHGWNDFDQMPKTFEMQVRTLFMHAWAEPQHDLNYKGPSDLKLETKKELSWIAASAWGGDQALNRIWGILKKNP